MCKALADNEASTEYATGGVCPPKEGAEAVLCLHLQNLPPAMETA